MGGATPIGLESTIVDASGQGLRILRPGSITAQTLVRLVDVIDIQTTDVSANEEQSITAPGQLASHYAPRARVRLNAKEKRDGEVLIGFGPASPVDVAFQLSATGDLDEAAQNLFQALRVADGVDAKVIAVMPIPESGVGLAINDRLRRAAAPRNLSAGKN